MVPIQSSAVVVRAARAFAWICAVIAALWLLLSAVAKLQNPGEFIETMILHDIVPRRFQPFCGYLVIGLEFSIAVIGLFHAACSRLREALCAVVVFYAMLTIYSGLLWYNPPKVPVSCGCGVSRAAVESWGFIFGRNLTLTIALGMALVWIRSRRTLTTR
jgi:hypothetical protein